MENLLAVIVATVMFIYALSRIKISIRLIYRRREADDFVRVEVYLLRRLMAYGLTIPLIEIIESRGVPWLETEVESKEDDLQTHAGREQRFVAKLVEIFLNQPMRWRNIVREAHFLFRLYQRISRRIQRVMKCEKLIWRTGFGCDDAALTGMVSGFLWVIKSEIYIILKRRIDFVAKPVLQVRSIFTKVHFEMEFECIFTLRVGNVINAAWSLINFPLKGVKGSG